MEIGVGRLVKGKSTKPAISGTTSQNELSHQSAVRYPQLKSVRIISASSSQRKQRKHGGEAERDQDVQPPHLAFPSISILARLPEPASFSSGTACFGRALGVGRLVIG